MEIHLHGNAKGQVLQLNDVSDAELCAMLSAMKMAGEKLGVKVDYYSRTTPIRSYGSKGS
jgi:phosphoribosylformylglycinamidine (FGAM) synthase-like enzyme